MISSNSAAPNNSFQPTLASESLIIKLDGILLRCRFRAGFGRLNSGVGRRVSSYENQNIYYAFLTFFIER